MVVLDLGVLVRVAGITFAPLVGRAQCAVGVISMIILELQVASVPVDGDGGCFTDLLGLGTRVLATLLLKRVGATLTAEELIIDDDGTVGHVTISWWLGSLNVDVGARDGLRQGKGGAEREEPRRHGERQSRDS